MKRFLRERIRTDIGAEHDELVDRLPDDIESFEEAEGLLRKGTLKIPGRLLQCWLEVAERELAVPRCPACKTKMRHRGLRACNITTTIGDIAYKRPRYVCEKCGKMVYPHDAAAKFLAHGVSQSLAQVIARMGADGPFEPANAPRVSLADRGAPWFSGLNIEESTVSLVAVAYAWRL